MAKITIEDCLDYVENRFELVLIASKRAKELEAGARPLFETKKQEKSTLIALREIGAGLIPARNVLEYEAWLEHRREILRNESFELEL